MLVMPPILPRCPYTTLFRSVLAGTCSLFCEKLITGVRQCPRYPGNSCGRFANGEISVNLSGPVRGDDVFVVQSMVSIESASLSNSGALMELALLIHSVQLAAAARITAVIPFLAYTRNVASISAVAELIEAMRSEERRVGKECRSRWSA